MNTFPETVPGSGGAAVDMRQVHYQDLKERIHRTLLNRLNLDRLNRVGRAEAEPEIRGLIVSLLDAERSSTPLSLYERETLITDVFHELFGLGPLEVLLADPTISDILVNKADRIFVEQHLERAQPEQLVEDVGDERLALVEAERGAAALGIE